MVEKVTEQNLSMMAPVRIIVTVPRGSVSKPPKPSRFHGRGANKGPIHLTGRYAPEIHGRGKA